MQPLTGKIQRLQAARDKMSSLWIQQSGLPG